MKPPKDIKQYLRISAVAFFVVGLFSNGLRARYIVGVGFLLLAVSFIIKKKTLNMN